MLSGDAPAAAEPPRGAHDGDTAAAQEEEEHEQTESSLALATMADQALLQRSPAAGIIPLRDLGRGAFASIELATANIGGVRKLLVCKRLSTTDAATAAEQQPSSQQPLKLSSLQDWTREASMHRQCEGCPFVLQLLAAKRCRGGSLLLLTEVGSGSLTDVLARLQVTGKEQEHPPVLLRVDTADDAAAVGSVLHPAGVAPAAAAVLLHGVDAAEDAAAGDDRTAAAAAAAPEERPGLCEDAARFYTGCILMGLQWLHSRRIVHRDVKPCNLLLFGDGYMKLADLGGCVLLPPGIDAAHTRTGTASHMAPEVLSSGSGSGGSGYSFPVDLWSLGVTLWQMVAGRLPPWAGQEGQQADAQQQQAAAAAAASPDVLLPLQPPLGAACHAVPKALQFPAHFSAELRELLSGLLRTDSAARLSVAQVQAAAWFRGFDWQAMQDKTLAPPVLP